MRYHPKSYLLCVRIIAYSLSLSRNSVSVESEARAQGLKFDSRTRATGVSRITLNEIFQSSTRELYAPAFSYLILKGRLRPKKSMRERERAQSPWHFRRRVTLEEIFLSLLYSLYYSNSMKFFHSYSVSKQPQPFHFPSLEQKLEKESDGLISDCAQATSRG